MDKESIDIPDAVADTVVWSLRHSLPARNWVAHRSWYRWYWGWYLGCDLTLEEADSIRARLNGLGPVRYEDTWGYFAEHVGRSTEPFFRAELPASRPITREDLR